MLLREIILEEEALLTVFDKVLDDFFGGLFGLVFTEADVIVEKGSSRHHCGRYQLIT